LISHLTPLDGSYTAALQSTTSAIAGQGASIPDAAAQAQGVLYGVVQRNAAMMAAADTFRTLAIIFLCLIPLILLLRRTKAQAGHVVME
jgi:hypothetical protein